MAKKEGYSVKQEIAKALLQLMTKKSYMEITVSDIITEAKVARASFYRNFSSISDVIDRMVEERTEDFAEGVLPVLYSTDERKWREFLFRHFYLFARRQPQFRELLPQNRDILFSRMDKKMQQLESEAPPESIREKYLVAAKMGMINDITRKWFDSGMKETPEEMVDYILSIVMLF